MICGKCFSEKQNVLIDQVYPVGGAILTIHHIPATQCNCRIYVSNSVNQEIAEYIENSDSKSGQIHISYSEV
ncbi:MAG: hypothetical protein KBT36_01800 [Kurthia sp.]|nr:hypothetical protein [Candidatus Kurthia equi]